MTLPTHMLSNMYMVWNCMLCHLATWPAQTGTHTLCCNLWGPCIACMSFSCLHKRTWRVLMRVQIHFTQETNLKAEKINTRLGKTHRSSKGSFSSELNKNLSLFSIPTTYMQLLCIGIPSGIMQCRDLILYILMNRLNYMHIYLGAV